MKIKIDKKLFKRYIYMTISLCVVILFYKIIVIDNINPIGQNLSNLLKFVYNTSRPFIIGIVIAYFLFRPVIWIEKYLIKQKYFIKHKRAARILSILIVYLISFTLLFLFFYAMVPRTVESISAIVVNMPNYLEQTQEFIDNFTSHNTLSKFIEELTFSSNTLENIKTSNNFQDIILSFIENTQYLLEKTVNYVIDKLLLLSSFLINLILAIFIGLYLMLDKENIMKQVDILSKTIIPIKFYNAFKKIFGIIDEIFFNYFVGKILCSILIGFICLIGLFIIKVKFAWLIALIVGVTNVIPYFGPIFGAIPGIIITLFESPIKAFWVMILILIIQQFDGNILGPTVLGKVVELNPFWIIFAIIVGGKLFGVAGMFLAIPVFAVAKTLLSEWVMKRNTQENNPGD